MYVDSIIGLNIFSTIVERALSNLLTASEISSSKAQFSMTIVSVHEHNRCYKKGLIYRQRRHGVLSWQVKIKIEQKHFEMINTCVFQFKSI